MLKPFAMPLAAAGLALTVLVGTYIFLLAPIEQRSATSRQSLRQHADPHHPGQVCMAPSRAAEPVLWARDMMAVGAACHTT